MTAASAGHRPAPCRRGVGRWVFVAAVLAGSGACGNGTDERVAVGADAEVSSSTSPTAVGVTSNAGSGSTGTSLGRTGQAGASADTTTTAPFGMSEGGKQGTAGATSTTAPIETDGERAASSESADGGPSSPVSAPERDVVELVRSTVGGTQPTPAAVLDRLAPGDAGEGPERPQWSGEVGGTDTVPVLSVRVRRLPDDAVAGYDLTVTLTAAAAGWDVASAWRTDLCRRAVSPDGFCL